MGVSRALQECANDLDNVAIIAIPEFSGAGTNVSNIVVNMTYMLTLYIKLCYLNHIDSNNFLC